MRLRLLVVAYCLWSAASLLAAADASLNVQWAGTVPSTSQQLSLIPVDVAAGSGFRRAEAIQAWTIAATPKPRWEGLPPGTYRIVLRGSGTPVELGEIVLAPGDDASVTLTSPETKPEPQHRSTLVLSLPERLSEAVVTALWSEDGERIPLTPASVRAHGDGVLLEFPGRCHERALAVVETTTTIGAVRLDDCARPLRVVMRPRATLVTRLVAPEGFTIPAWGIVRFAQCDLERPFARNADDVRIPVAESCGNPSLRVRGFAPVVIGARSVASIALRPGATAVLQIRSAKRAEPLKGVRVSAVRANDVASMQRELQVDGAALATGVTDASGWVRLEGLPEEPIVFVLQAAERRIPQVSETYTFRAGDEALVDDVLFESGAEISISVSMKKELERSLELRSVDLIARGMNPWPARVPIHAEKTEAGYVARDVPPGQWRVVAVCRVNNTFLVPAANQEIEVSGGETELVSLDIRKPVFSGRVMHRDAPVAGTINLTPANRREGGSSAVAALANDGTFQVLLEPGEYRATVHSSRLGVTLGSLITFDDPEDEVQIELPSRRIAGRVVDAGGTPVGSVGLRATETLASSNASAGARAADDGRFVIDGVSSGTWQVAVAGESGISEPMTVSVDDADVDGVVLTFEPTRTVKVRVVDVTGAPVPGAFVHIEVPSGEPAQFEAVLRMTQANGEAAFRVTRRQQTVPVTLVTYTADSRLSCALGRLDADQTVTVPPMSGEVRLAGNRERPGVRTWLVSSAGCAVPFLGTRVDRNGDGEAVVVFPRLAVGQWSYVETHSASEQRALLSGAIGSLSARARFEVTPGRTTSVRVE